MEDVGESNHRDGHCPIKAGGDLGAILSQEDPSGIEHWQAWKIERQVTPQLSCLLDQ